MYGDATSFDTYLVARGKAIPVGWDTADKNAAILVASEWIDSVFGLSFIGYKKDGFTQAREWPRTSATVYENDQTYTYGDTVVPERVLNATYEAAFREATTPGLLHKDFTPEKYKSVKIDGAVGVNYAGFSQSYESQIQMPVIEAILRPLIDPSSSHASSGQAGKSERV